VQTGSRQLPEQLDQGGILTLSDDDVTRLIVSQAAEAHRLAAWILHDPTAAEDVVADAALAAWKSRRDLRRSDNPEGWFTTVVVNICRDELRRRQRPSRFLGQMEMPDSDAERLCLRDQIEQGMSRLDPDERVLLALRFGRDLSVPQIARQLAIAEGTVKSRLHHTLEHLRAAIEAEERVQPEERVP
jgi:RNA polymerase sigma-70 factor, ECF subfamily